MADQIVQWRYNGYGGGEPLYSIGVARYVAEQKDASGHPLIGGKPVGDERLGPPPEGFKVRGLRVRNPRFLTLNITSRSLPVD